MNICIPIEKDQGFHSVVSCHFGSAPLLLMVDTETLVCRAIPNTHRDHSHGMCHPVAALSGEKVDGIVVGGIGMGALNKLNAAGYRVFQSRFVTAKEAIEAFNTGKLPAVLQQNVCRGGRGGQGCQ